MHILDAIISVAFAAGEGRTATPNPELADALTIFETDCFGTGNDMGTISQPLQVNLRTRLDGSGNRYDLVGDVELGEDGSCRSSTLLVRAEAPGLSPIVPSFELPAHRRLGANAQRFMHTLESQHEGGLPTGQSEAYELEGDHRAVVSFWDPSPLPQVARAPRSLAALSPVQYLEVAEQRILDIHARTTEVERRQQALREQLEALGATVRPYWLVNAMEVWGNTAAIAHLTDAPGLKALSLDEVSEQHSSLPEARSQTQIQQFWNEGIDAQLGSQEINVRRNPGQRFQPAPPGLARLLSHQSAPSRARFPLGAHHWLPGHAKDRVRGRFQPDPRAGSLGDHSG